MGFINLQPLEVTKLALVIYLAYVLDRRDGKLVRGKIKDNLSHPAMLAGFLMCLVIVEPDFWWYRNFIHDYVSNVFRIWCTS